MKKGILEFGFIISIFIFTVSMFILSLKFSFKDAIIPVTAASLIIILTIYEIIKHYKLHLHSSRLPKTVENHESYTQSIDRKEFGVLIWLAFSGAAIYLLGFIPSIFVCSLLYFRIYIYQKINRPIIISLVIVAVMYIIFASIAGYDLYPGIFF